MYSFMSIEFGAFLFGCGMLHRTLIKKKSPVNCLNAMTNIEPRAFFGRLSCGDSNHAMEIVAGTNDEIWPCSSPRLEGSSDG